MPTCDGRKLYYYIELGRIIEYEVCSDGKEITWVKDREDGEKIELDLYLKNNVDTSLHEMIRRHVFIATQNYQRRVKAFITNIMEDKNNPMHVEYWTTKVEFQGRGAGHNHGTIWVDMPKMEFSFVDNDGRWSDLDCLMKLSQGNMSNLKSDLKRLLKACFVNNAEVEETDKTLLKNIYAQIFQTEESNSELE